jgi:sodium/hydrogen antiporter
MQWTHPSAMWLQKAWWKRGPTERSGWGAKPNRDDRGGRDPASRSLRVATGPPGDQRIGPHRPAENLVAAQVTADDLQEPTVAAGVLLAETLSFGDTLERRLEVLLVILVGVCLARHWDLRAVPLALALFVVIRPVSTVLLLAHTPTTPIQRRLMGWFGIRGIGSLYYLSYALSHGVSGHAAADASSLTVSVVALSVLLHGAMAQPLLSRYERALSGAERATR